LEKLQEQNAQAKSNKELNYFTDAKSINGVQNQMYITKPQGIFESVESIIKCR
jgi:hypothetical protein